MEIFSKFFNNARKPEGVLGKIMVSTMNSGHAKLADWGFSHLPPLTPEKAADLGCGGGRNVGELLKKYPNVHVSAIDYSDISVAKARDYNKQYIQAGRCTIQQGDVSKLQLPASKFDLVTAFETIYFWPGLEKCFGEVAKILKPGGYFMICNESDGIDEAGRKFEKIIDGMKVYTVSDIEAALSKAGFSEIKSDHHSSKPWITVLAKK